MKRFWLVCMTMLLLILLLGCTEQQTEYSVMKNGIEYRVDTAQNTISDGENIYDYVFSGDHENFNITITYPNGATYCYGQSNGVGSGSWSRDYTEGEYASADTLIDVARQNAPQKRNPMRFVGAAVLLALGLCDILAPKVTWFLCYGWRYKDAEPSDAALLFARIGGGVMMIFGALLIFS